MIYKNAYQGTIQRRYKRFLSDVTLDCGLQINAHVPNTGRMTACWKENWTVLLTKSDNPKRKLPYTLEMTHNGHTWISVNTTRTNHLVREALEKDVIDELAGYRQIKAEKSTGKSRLDFFLSDHPSHEDIYVEVKNTTLRDDSGRALFPDAVSTRGQQHLRELIQLRQQGHRAAMLYVVNREDVHSFTVADEIDPLYGQLLREAKKAGVLILAYQSKLTAKEIRIAHPMAVVL